MMKEKDIRERIIITEAINQGLLSTESPDINAIDSLIPSKYILAMWQHITTAKLIAKLDALYEVLGEQRPRYICEVTSPMSIQQPDSKDETKEDLYGLRVW